MKVGWRPAVARLRRWCSGAAVAGAVVVVVAEIPGFASDAGFLGGEGRWPSSASSGLGLHRRVV